MTNLIPLRYPITQVWDKWLNDRVNLIALFLCVLVSFAGCQPNTRSISAQPEQEQPANKQKANDKANQLNFRHDGWQPITVNVHRTYGPPFEVEAQQTTFRYGSEEFDHPMEVVAFKMPTSNKFWIGPVQDFYVEVDSNVNGGKLDFVKSNLYWRETMYDNKIAAPNLNAAITSFESQIDLLALSEAAMPSQSSVAQRTSIHLSSIRVGRVAF